MIKCVCIEDSNKPLEIPNTSWVKKGKVYTVIAVYKLVQPGALMGVLLKEIDLTTVNDVYECFRISRFGFVEDDLPKLLQLMKDCEDLQEFDFNKLLEEQVEILEEL